MVARAILSFFLLQVGLLFGGVQISSAQTEDALLQIPECAGVTKAGYSPQTCDIAAGAWLLDCLAENQSRSARTAHCSLEPKIEICSMRPTPAVTACNELLAKSWWLAMKHYEYLIIADLERPDTTYRSERMQRLSKAGDAYADYKSAACGWESSFKLGAREEMVDYVICTYKMDQQRTLKLIDQLSYLR